MSQNESLCHWIRPRSALHVANIGTSKNSDIGKSEQWAHISQDDFYGDKLMINQTLILAKSVKVANFNLGLLKIGLGNEVLFAIVEFDNVNL